MAAALLTRIAGASQLLSWRPKSLPDGGPIHKEPAGQSPETGAAAAALHKRRRAALLLAAAAVLPQLSSRRALAGDDQDNNGMWLTGPLPVPSVTNKIANAATGTRSFLRKGIYAADVGAAATAFRVKHYAFDLLALEDMIGKDTWNYFSKYLCLKATVMYYDFDKLISAAAAGDQQPLTDLASQLFDSVEKLEDAVKRRSAAETQACYADTKLVLQEVMARMA